LYGRAAQRHKEAAQLSPQEQNRGLVRSSVLAGQGEQALTTRARDERRARVTLQQRQEFGEWLGAGPEVSWAKRYWEEVAKDFPQLQAAHLGRARVALEEGDVAGAKKSLEALLDASGDDPNALTEALELWGEYGRWSELLDMGNARIPKEQAQAGVPVVPPRAWVSVGQAAYAVGKRERALELWDRAIEGSPDALQVKLRVARLLLGQGAWVQDKAQALRDARTYAERAAQEHAASPEAWLLRGEVRLRQGDKAGAWEDMSRGLSMGAWEQPRELGRLGALLLEAGETAHGEELLVRLMKLPTQPGASGLSEALSAFLQAGKPAEGLAFMRKHAPALASAPWADEALCSRVAELWAESGGVEQAVKLYEAGLVRFPRSGTLQNNLAWLLARKDKDLGRAERLALGALAAPDLQDEDRAVKLDTLAYIHHKQGNKGALAEQRQAAWLVGQGPRAGDVYARLGDLLEAQGDKAGAARARERSARQKKNN
jgi:tetratricopeptide (TPR) repeat protein